MKKVILNIFVLALVALTSCTDRFLEMNDNDYTSGDMDPKYQFTFIQAKLFSNGHEGFRGNLIMAGPMSGLTSNPQYTSGQGFGRNDSYSEASWTLFYADIAKNVEDIRVRLEARMENEGEQNLGKLSQVAIVRVINFLRITALYGDVPYSEAGKGYSEGILYPKYDSQEDIFEQMVAELLEARENINEGPLFIEDYYYSGNAASWERLANSLLMKIGIYMSAGNPTRGQEIFAEAYNTNNYISSLTESAILEHNESDGPWGQTVNGSGVANEGRVGGQSYQFISHKALVSMQKLEDPRLFWVASHVDNSGPTTAAFMHVDQYSDFDPFAYNEEEGEEFKKIHYRGVKDGDRPDGNRGIFTLNDGTVGYSAFTITKFDDEGNAYNNMDYKFSEGGQYAQLVAVNPGTILHATAPSIIMGSDEVHFMIAEAAQRGWVSANVNSHFKTGVEHAIRKYPTFFGSGSDYVSAYVDLYKNQTNPSYNWEAAVDNYVNMVANNMGKENDPIEDIVYQHWLSQIGNGYNSFALWNRTHFPSFVKATLGSEDRSVKVPLMSKDPIENEDAIKLGVEDIELHTGGVTNGYRPARFPYPNREFTVNPTNATEAVSNQNDNPSSDFISAKQFMSF
ncbi:SusD/RagB family nutrient-binding outer membrane lipoprotein [Flammeovirga sp. MY04]|uniref:SusD/RagB family nutrient-binding outer membrane lipoprotein n=1 Tax=Flammeovirga sp. MY04 TaxID=1191459 RepID=UPI000826AC6C|nr:SusD/RagB family nutrient-binding outer membrane lipoprotein [Flammeovirga sp. MY04]ANQ48067.2 SusD/RagB family nutrient-binding outer membrane lipoprotein [Flammeovirga sp. MY04]